jgi:hypothetical protein
MGSTASTPCCSIRCLATAADAANDTSHESCTEQQQQQQEQAATPLQLLTVPSLGELLGFGNLQQLLLLEQQQHTALQQADDTRISSQLGSMQPGDVLLLTSPTWIGLEQHMQQQQQLLQPEQMVAFWNARADAEAVRQQHSLAEDHSAATFSSSSSSANRVGRVEPSVLLGSSSSSSGSAAAHSVQLSCQPPPGGWGAPPGSSITQLAAAAGAWEQQQLRQLLQQHAGMGAQKAAGYVQMCYELQGLLFKLEELSAAAAGKAP